MGGGSVPAEDVVLMPQSLVQVAVACQQHVCRIMLARVHCCHPLQTPCVECPQLATFWVYS